MNLSTIRRALLALALIAATSLSAAAASATVTVRIDMRGPIRDGWFDPATETVGLRGGTPPLSWGVTLPATDPDHDGIYVVSVRFDRASGRSAFVSYKFKVDGTDNPNDGWESDGNRPLPLPSPRSTLTRAFNAAGPDFPQTLAAPIATYRDFASKYVSPRTVTVLLPPGYAAAHGVRYPVLYMHDGQNLFDARTAHGAEWQVDETAVKLMRSRQVASVIIVGVASTPDHRMADYTPTAIAEPGSVPARTAGGSADAYGRFLVEELKPFIDRTFRTMPDAAHTGLAGSSLGGLVTMYLGLKYPGTFGRLAIVSPSVWWDDHFIVKQVGLLDTRPPERIWLDIGTSESPEAAPDARLLRDALVAKGWALGNDLQYLEVEGGTHDESAWAARFGQALRFLFPPPR
ncbi:MAG TPA: alpha/beta hydrolase-fold protein [Blastocatellia bacterium]|nr:alpha/beta hydrolase-fold protein [Blastocatellia bacterium]